MAEREKNIPDKIARVYLPPGIYEEFDSYEKDDPVRAYVLGSMSTAVAEMLAEEGYLEEGDMLLIVPDVDVDAEENSYRRKVKLTKLIKDPATGTVVDTRTKKLELEILPEDIDKEN